jgi:hypothetical protein
VPLASGPIRWWTAVPSAYCATVTTTETAPRHPPAATWIAALVAVVALLAALGLHSRYNTALASADPASAFEGWGTGAGWAILSILAWLVFAASVLTSAVLSITWLRRR